ncbi:RrF2 family transcriptional regulator [Thalassovita aquimarina]|uniref:Rrf2 family transcriptional regulator n=1 Tax=Thalassovita aquimarina TaxID=2785917 RepID=A0ABS5HR40_9RHOB|nr:Rrf2 family transcriptional regulator [Thalassovita aquimarina]MBR9651417.1 Rrf2 family transcriptional regulator [Thalassovita aquimarina]
MRLTTRTNLAARVLMACAANPDRLIRTAEIAGICNSSAHHVAVVVQRLHAEGYLSTLRGRSGGLRLARQADQVSIGAVFRLFEADIPFAECFDTENNTCPLTETCRLRGYVQRAVEAFYHELDMVTLEDLVRGNCGLIDLLAMQPEPPARCIAESARQ